MCLVTCLLTPQTYKRIAQVDLRFPDHVSSSARDLITRVRSHHTHTLPPCSCIAHSLTRHTSALLQLLRKDPKARMPLVEVPKHKWFGEMRRVEEVMRRKRAAAKAAKAGGGALGTSGTKRKVMGH